MVLHSPQKWDVVSKVVISPYHGNSDIRHICYKHWDEKKLTAHVCMFDKECLIGGLPVSSQHGHFLIM